MNCLGLPRRPVNGIFVFLALVINQLNVKMESAELNINSINDKSHMGESDMDVWQQWPSYWSSELGRLTHLVTGVAMHSIGHHPRSPAFMKLDYKEEQRKMSALWVSLRKKRRELSFLKLCNQKMNTTSTRTIKEWVKRPGVFRRLEEWKRSITLTLCILYAMGNDWKTLSRKSMHICLVVGCEVW